MRLVLEENSEENFLPKKKEMEGLYVRFKETDHSIWIGTDMLYSFQNIHFKISNIIFTLD